MEMLGYSHMAMVYEETVSPLNLQPVSLQWQFSLKRVSSTAAIIGVLILGGFSALMTSAISRPTGIPMHHQGAGF
ncbi:MAG: hypothetical protein EA366_02095 [Spirulina sp. DLM2.Bin59]|nr:MAG: hypothetical protein EA366_02095 [Spirulina sp. DLM2.Bin59]